MPHRNAGLIQLNRRTILGARILRAPFLYDTHLTLTSKGVIKAFLRRLWGSKRGLLALNRIEIEGQESDRLLKCLYTYGKISIDRFRQPRRSEKSDLSI